jgi:hypothetical protein
MSTPFVTKSRFMAFATELATTRRWPIFPAVEIILFVLLFG